MKKLKDGQTHNATHHRCTQTKCAYYLHGGCRNCDDCGSEPYEMQNSCDRCYACEHIPDALRWGDKNWVAIQEAQRQREEKLLQIGGIEQ